MLTHENLLEEIEYCFPIWKKEIARIAELARPTREDIYLTIKLATAMREAFVAYSILKTSIKKAVAYTPPDKLKEMIAEYKNRN